MRREDGSDDAEADISGGLRLTRTSAGALLLALSALLAGTDARAANPCLAANESAQDLMKSGKLKDARAALLLCARPTCNNVVRGDCERWLKDVDRDMPSLVVRPVDARGRDVLGVRVTIDGQAVELDGSPVALDPGQHVIRAKARSGDVAKEEALVAIGEKARVLQIRFPVALEQDGTKTKEEAPPGGEKDGSGDKPPKADGPSLVAPAALAGVGVVALGVFTYFEIAGQSGYSDLKNGCGRTAAKCSPQDIEAVRGDFVGAAISLGVAVVALAAAGILYFTRKPSSATAVSYDGSFRF